MIYSFERRVSSVGIFWLNKETFKVHLKKEHVVMNPLSLNDGMVEAYLLCK